MPRRERVQINIVVQAKWTGAVKRYEKVASKKLSAVARGLFLQHISELGFVPTTVACPRCQTLLYDGDSCPNSGIGSHP